MDERDAGTRRRSLLGEGETRWHTIGMLIGVLVIFGYPVLILLAKLAALFGIHQ